MLLNVLEDEVTINEVTEAYLKYKSYIYYDTSELFQRAKIAEFEYELINGNGPLTTSETLNSIMNENETHLQPSSGKLKEKLSILTQKINRDNIDHFFDEIILKCSYQCLPKKIHKNPDTSIVTNKRSNETYLLDKITIFADIPIELHIVSILWIMKFGYKLDNKLSPSCVGNRLKINKGTKKIVKGNKLFKPYFIQYQSWRDNAIKEAKRKLDDGHNVAILNLDLQDYFYSTRIDFNKIEKEIELKSNSNIHSIFKRFHEHYTSLLVSINYPYNYNKSEIGECCIIPIGVASSYVLANFYLKEFDTRILKKIPQIYYSRYVDDIIIVLDNPDFEYNDNEECKEIKFDIATYLRREKIQNFKLNLLTKLEKFLLETFSPIIKLVDIPIKFIDKSDPDPPNRIFKITCVNEAYFQSKKTIFYYFDSKESTAAIDKLKQELDERISEFRDFPEDEEGNGGFDEQAYHLVFDDSQGKIRTLKDYKENSFGLSVYLANKIFAYTRQDKIASENETEKILKLFKGANNLEYFRLWEKIFTLFLVSKDIKSYLQFYKNTVIEISKLSSDVHIRNSSIYHSDVSVSLLKYLQIAFEMSFALNPNFFKDQAKILTVEMDFFNLNIISNSKLSIWLDNPIKNESFKRFRVSNLIRHHYVTHPLANYTALAFTNYNYVEIQLPSDINQFDLIEYAIFSSPRNVSYWECCIYCSYYQLLRNINIDLEHQTIFNEQNDNFILVKAKVKYCEVNSINYEDLGKFAFDRKPVNINNTGFNNVLINDLLIVTEHKLPDKPIISIANTKIPETDIKLAIQGRKIPTIKKYNQIITILNSSRRNDADVIVMPENCLPYNFIAMVARFSQKNQIAVVTGLEHININGLVHNFILTIIPFVHHGIEDSIVLFRLKNHYAPNEKHCIEEYHYKYPKLNPYRYDLFNWSKLYFTTFYCFELADSYHRSLFKSKIDLLIASEWNKDTNYYSNIVESMSRDLHCYVAQANTSQYGDSRLTSPTDTASKDLLKIKGGQNDTVLVESIDLSSLREFQLKNHLNKDNKNYKPLPPDWETKHVKSRIDNKRIEF